MSAADEPAVECVAGFMFGNLGSNAKQVIESEEARAEVVAALHASVSETSGPVRGTNGEALTAEAMQYVHAYDLLRHAEPLSERTVLLIGATQDDLVPVAERHQPLVRALHKAGADRLTEVVLETDHYFVTNKVALAQILLGWLRDRCRY